MKADRECHACFLGQTLKTVRRLTGDDGTVEKVHQAVEQFLSKTSFDRTPPEIGRDVYRLIAGMTGIPDPYRRIKQECTRRALALYPGLQRRIRAAADPLLAAVKAAVAGNVIDFGVDISFDLEAEVESILSSRLVIDHSDCFRDALDRAGRILYLGDNAGETVFDRLLIEQLGKPVIYAVRSRPVINDAVAADAEEAGLGQVSEIVSSGSDAPGTVLPLCTDSFRKKFREAELIISKGQGNFECLSGEKGPLFYLLKAKCPVISRHIGVPQGSLLLVEGGAVF